MKEIFLLSLIIFGSCSHEKAYPEKFILDNKNRNLDMLFGVVIEARNKRNDTLHYYYSHTFINNDSINIPSYEYFDDFIEEEKEYYLKEVAKLAIAKGVTSRLSISYAKEYSKKLDSLYKGLGVINIISLPNTGRFIRFTLSPDCVVYYLEDVSTLTPYWKDFFSKIEKSEERWFYDCK